MPLPAIEITRKPGGLVVLALAFARGRRSIAIRELPRYLVRLAEGDLDALSAAFKGIGYSFSDDDSAWHINPHGNNWARKERQLAQWLQNNTQRAMWQGISRALKRPDDDYDIWAIGCLARDYVRYLEDRFERGMSWGNRATWYIGYIEPLELFDLHDLDERAVAFHYTNTRPLWS